MYVCKLIHAFPVKFNFRKAMAISIMVHALLVAMLLHSGNRMQLNVEVNRGLSSIAGQNGADGAFRGQDSRSGYDASRLPDHLFVSVDMTTPVIDYRREKVNSSYTGKRTRDIIGAITERAKSNSKNLPPRYPYAARRMQAQGRVLLAIEVLPSGKAGRVEVQRSSGYDILDSAAVSAVKLWFFFEPHELILSEPLLINQEIAFILQ